jgi:hypothetical protein
VIHHGILGHHHVQLARVHGQVADDVQAVLHHCHGVVLEAGAQGIFGHRDGKAGTLQDVGDQMNAPHFPEIIGGPALETEDDVVLRHPLAHIAFHGGKMKTETRHQAAVVFGDHEVVALGILGVHAGDQGGVARGLEHHRKQALAVDGRRSLPGHLGDPLPQGPHGNGGDVLQRTVGPSTSSVKPSSRFRIHHCMGTSTTSCLLDRMGNAFLRPNSNISWTAFSWQYRMMSCRLVQWAGENVGASGLSRVSGAI